MQGWKSFEVKDFLQKEGWTGLDGELGDEVLKSMRGSFSGAMALSTTFNVFQAETDGCNILRKRIMDRKQAEFTSEKNNIVS